MKNRKSLNNSIQLSAGKTNVIGDGYYAKRRKIINHKRRYSMPDFGNPFSGLAKGGKLTEEELIRAIRFMIAGEFLR